MPKLQELREERSKLRDSIDKLRDELTERRKAGKAGDELLSPEERSNWDKLRTDYGTLRSQIEAEERADDLLKWMSEKAEAEERSRGAGGRPDPRPENRIPGTEDTYGDLFGNDRGAARHFAESEERRALALSAWAASGAKGMALTEEQRSACHKMGFDPSGGQIEFQTFRTDALKTLRRAAGYHQGEERAAMIHRALERVEQRAVVKATDGDTLVPQVMVRAFEQAVLTYGGLVNAADVIVSPDGGKMTWPTGDDTANEGKQIDEVTAQDTDGTDPDFAPLSLTSFEFSSDFIRVGNPTIRDTPFDLATVLGNMIGERLAKIINRRATSGAGGTTLKGILTDLAVGREMTDPSAYTWQELLRLKHAVDSHYRESGAYMLNDEVLLQYALLTDDHGRPILIEPNSGAPGRLMGKPYVLNNHMPTPDDVTAEGGIPVIFGDLKAYKLRLVGQVRTERIRERFVEFNQTAFIGFRGADGALLEAGSPVKALQGAAPGP